MQKIFIRVSALLGALFLSNQLRASTIIPFWMKDQLDKRYLELKNERVQKVNWLSRWYIKKYFPQFPSDRIEGAKKISAAIDELGYSDIFKVPQKYRYVSPAKELYFIAQAYHPNWYNQRLNVNEVKKLFKIATS